MQHRPINFKSPVWLDIMLLLLAAVAGSIDVMSYFELDHVFTANMTGNTILLGLAIGQGKFSSAVHSLVALAGFITGAFIGALIIENKNKKWRRLRRDVILSLAIESAIIAALAVFWMHHHKTPDAASLYISIIFSAIAMGMQSATIRYLKIPGIVTTYITGTIASISMSIVKGLRQGFKKRIKDSTAIIPVAGKLEQRIELQVLIFLAYGLTAVITGWIEFHGVMLIPLLPLALVLCVLVIAIIQPVDMATE